jgi:hypothetical protein
MFSASSNRGIISGGLFTSRWTNPNLGVFEEKTLPPVQSAAVIAAWEAVKE